MLKMICIDNMKIRTQYIDSHILFLIHFPEFGGSAALYFSENTVEGGYACKACVKGDLGYSAVIAPKHGFGGSDTSCI